MFNLSDTHHFRKLVAGVCMVFAPLFLLASTIVSPALDLNETQLLANVAEHPDRWYLANLFAMVAIVLAVPAVLGLMHMLRERRSAEGHVGGAFALIGLFAAMAATAVSMVTWQMVAGGADQAQMAALLDRVNTTAGTFVPIYIAGFGIGLGLLVLAYGLMQARVVHWSQAFCIAVGGIALNVGFAMASIALAIVAAAFLFVGFGSIGRMVMSETDEEWEHTPEFRGFRPVAGAS